jgi:hypothetical protein
MVNSYNRRGISTIVGGIIFLVLLTSGFSAFYIAINTQREISKNIVEKTQEQFLISAGTNPVDNKLGIQVKNQGPNPVEITNIWIINKSSIEVPPNSANRYDINYEDALIPPGYGAPILENTPLYLAPNDYTVKVVSSLGSIKQTDLTVGGPNNLLAELFTIPPDVRIGENVTIALRVTNVGDTPLIDVEPHYIPPDVNPLFEIDTYQFISPTPVKLDPAESTVFTWHYKLKGSATIGNKVTFTSAANATDSATGFDILSNNATDRILIRDPQGGSGEELVLKDELFGRPELFVIMPNIFGESDDKALLGLTIANPTNKTMTVNKATINFLRANSNDNQRVLIAGCGAIAISPLAGWSCPNENALVWKGSQIVGPISSYSFMARVEPGSLVNLIGLESIVATTSTFTSLGAFGKGPYETSMRRGNDADALVNVYFSDPGGSRADAAIRGSILGIQSGETRQFNVTMADFDSGPEAITAGSQLIINIPKDFSLIGNPVGFGFTIPLPITPFPDGSTQIIGNLDANLDDGAQHIEFTLQAPTVSSTKMYVFHILGTGSTTPAPTYAIGPLAETVVQVCPGVCP